MFYCNVCRIENKWPDSIRKSYGKCECCGVQADCNDVPSSQLPKPPKPEPDYQIILKGKIDYYGKTEAAYQLAAEEYARQYHEYHK